MNLAKRRRHERNGGHTRKSSEFGNVGLSLSFCCHWNGYTTKVRDKGNCAMAKQQSDGLQAKIHAFRKLACDFPTDYPVTDSRASHPVSHSLSENHRATLAQELPTFIRQRSMTSRAFRGEKPLYLVLYQRLGTKTYCQLRNLLHRCQYIHH